ncbi:MAG TPA: hypothetical protein EYO90_03115 [Candidatus Latescibacteria bacterium]|nr:hypothetical protein [Candidatus Latescibacterota bacterium]
MDAGSGSSSVVGKVAAVVDGTTLVLNVGGEQGVTEGMVFAIAAQYQEISDPDTDESLGNWEVEKARVVVSHVQERMCTVRSPLTPAAAPIGTLSTMMVRHSFGLYGNHGEDRQSLEVRTSGLAGRPRSQPIQVGDVARSIAVAEPPTAVAETPQPGVADNNSPAAPDLPSSTYEATQAASPASPASSEQAASPAPAVSTGAQEEGGEQQTGGEGGEEQSADKTES